MTAFTGLILLLVTSTHGLQSVCDATPDAVCYGALGGPVHLQLMRNTTGHELNFKNEKNIIFRIRPNGKLAPKPPSQRWEVVAGNGTLIINPAESTDSGTYRVEIYENSTGTLVGTHTVQLMIEETVSDVNLSISCSAYGERRVRCSSNGGSPQYSWSLDGRALSEWYLDAIQTPVHNLTDPRSAVLTLIQEVIQGHLTCSAFNNVSSINDTQLLPSCTTTPLPTATPTTLVTTPTTLVTTPTITTVSMTTSNVTSQQSNDTTQSGSHTSDDLSLFIRKRKMDSAELMALKGKRSTAQALFSKRANKLSLTVKLLEKGLLIDETRALGVDFERVHDTGLEYIDALGEVEKAEEETAHAKEKTAKCLATYTEVLQLARDTLWFKYANDDIQLYADGAERKCAELESTDMKMLLEEEYQVLKESLSERIHMLEQKVLEWEGLVDGSKIKVYKQQLYDLGNRLREWAQSWKRLNHSKPEGPTGAGIKPHVPNTPYAPPPSGISLARLCGTIAWMRRAVETWLGGNSQAPVCSKWEARPYLSAEERAVAFKSLALAVQDGVEFHDTTMDRLVVQKEEKTGLLLCGGRIQRWEEDRVAVPLIPCQSWLATLLAREAHEENHEGVASTLLRTRRKAWIMQGRRTVKKVLNSCVTCRK
ncbi:hypothetical protein ACEWY4_015596 [Coilia grayii]|uniref:Integrase zinc-binding domain-containing protein n=1 Tax=Coilia grayii TaxID=363190 RepID=A0ABD1JNK0_9TELE